MTGRLWSVPEGTLGHFVCQRVECAEDFEPIIQELLLDDTVNAYMTKAGIVVELTEEALEGVVDNFARTFSIIACQCGKVGYDPLRKELVDSDEKASSVG